MNANFSFIILILNEGIHLDRLFDSIVSLEAQIYVLDSGNTDSTLRICERRGVQVRDNDFINHPEQWAPALEQSKINTPWKVGLNAVQTLSAELYDMLQELRAKVFHSIDAIYFNKKNYFRKRRIKYGKY
jgi:glycosyltransferase involved in cell wall biosynthesis